MSLLVAENLDKVFRRSGWWGKGEELTHAVSDVSFTLDEGKTLAIVGESGSGKSTTARMIMRLLEVDGGRIHLAGEEITHLRGKQLRMMRRHMQMVFQDPFASLNPRMRIGETVAEGLRVHESGLNATARRQRVAEMLERCGLKTEAMERYPHQFSGGQRQRVGIARALAVSPKLVVLDEPVSALDVSVQAQILNLLKQLQREQRLSYLFISHDLSVVRQMADRVAVMFAGRIVEYGDTESVFLHPRHPYTRVLLDARPMTHPSERKHEAATLARDTERTADSGCAFRLRCKRAESDCESFDGSLSADSHSFACLHPLEKV